LPAESFGHVVLNLAYGRESVEILWEQDSDDFERVQDFLIRGARVEFY
jgi:hypothetical protein